MTRSRSVDPTSDNFVGLTYRKGQFHRNPLQVTPRVVSRFAVDRVLSPHNNHRAFTVLIVLCFFHLGGKHITVLMRARKYIIFLHLLLSPYIDIILCFLPRCYACHN